MDADERRRHWDKAYTEKGEAGVSWFEARPLVSLDLIAEAGGRPTSALIDIGGGASRLVDALVEAGWRSLAVLDISRVALDAARKRLGAAAGQVDWIAADITRWQPARTYDLWHDRAVFGPGGHAIIASFAPDGPERCSGLPVMRYDAAALAATIGPAFALAGERRSAHTTPWGSSQAFQFSLLRRR